MLYYPHYTPSRNNLRAILLFSENVSLIVPRIDQHGVQQRNHVEELLNYDDSVINFKDPTHKYGRWIRKQGVMETVENLILDLMYQVEEEGDVERVRTDKFGRVELGQEDAIGYLWSSKGWKYIARQKFPQSVNELFFGHGLALQVGHFRDPTNGRIIEHDGVLCHPKLADFVVSRMAREVSLTEGLPSITFGGVNYLNHLYDGQRVRRQREYLLLQATMDLLIPDSLSKMNPNEYFLVRQEYEPLRRRIWSYLNDIADSENLHMNENDQSKFIEKLNRARQKIDEELTKASIAVGEKRFRSGLSFTLESATTIGLATIGAMSGGPIGAAITTGIGIAVSQATKRMSTVDSYVDDRAELVAMTKGKVENIRMPKKLSRPSYWV